DFTKSNLILHPIQVRPSFIHGLGAIPTISRQKKRGGCELRSRIIDLPQHIPGGKITDSLGTDAQKYASHIK
ncbi:MAG: hypothetical protein J0653_05995, partial [Deltaproteobacteria bacterium]|nr:hypothetical protein [Deltaproteobacteria bacterium]